MLGRLKKKKTEGWSIPDVPESRLCALFRSLRGSTKAWIASFVGAIVFGVFLLVSAGPRDSLDRVQRPVPPHVETGPYLDGSHKKFIDGFVANMKKRGIRVQVEFVNAGVVNLTMLDSSNLDDVTFAAKMLGVGIKNRFHNSALIHVYAADGSNPSRIQLIALSRWNKRANGFTVAFVRPGARGTETMSPDEMDE